MTKPTTEPTTKEKTATTQSLDRLLTGFAGNRIVFWVLVAIAVHVAVILGTSMTFVRDWIDPDGAKERATLAQAEQKKAERAEAAAAAPAMAGLTNAAAVVRDVDGGSAATAPRDTSAIPADRAGTPVAQRITEVAKPEEMPSLGNGLGISLEDTSLR